MRRSEQLNELYTELLGVPDGYYRFLKWLTEDNPQKYVASDTNFLAEITACRQLPKNCEYAPTDKRGDTRIDVPVWFGDTDNARHRIMVVGLEPRSTNNEFNVLREGDKVFASPFGADQWNVGSKISGKHHLKYCKVLEPLLKLAKNNKACLLLTDIVKGYEVITGTETAVAKADNDKNARDTFIEKVLKYRTLFRKEVQILNPSHVIAFGSDLNFMLQLILGEDFSTIFYKVRHPAHGGVSDALNRIEKIAEQIGSKI